MQKVVLAEKFAAFTDTWSPKIVGEVNDFHVKVAKLQGEFVWHHHETEDELFLVIKGQLRIEFNDHEVTLNEGEFLVVPRGVAHRPVADEECQVLLLEPKTTLNTGNVLSERTVSEPRSI